MDEKNDEPRLARFTKRKDLRFGYKKLLTEDTNPIQNNERICKAEDEEEELDHFCCHFKPETLLREELPSASTITPLCFDMDVEPIYSNNFRGNERKKKKHCNLYKKSLKSRLFSILIRLRNLFRGYRTDTVERIIWLNGKTSPQCLNPNLLQNNRYTIFTLIPGVILQQLTIFFNIFYLTVAVTQFLPQLRIGPLFTYIAPFSCVLCATIAKEGYDDYQRYMRDKEINDSLYEVWDSATLTCRVKKAKDIKVGDILKLHENQRVPCDSLLLQVHTKTGVTFIRTDQLDGETDWKMRRPIGLTQSIDFEKNDLENLHAYVIIEPPRKEIYEFVGNFYMEKQCRSCDPQWESSDKTDTLQVKQPIPGEASQTILSVGGCETHLTKTTVCFEDHPRKTILTESLSLENILWATTFVTSGPVWVLCVYTGCDLRAVLNTSKNQYKTGIFDQEINTLSKTLFYVLVLVSIILASLKGMSRVWFVNFVRFVLLLSSILPISLRINLDLAKAYYSYVIASDHKIKPTIVRNVSILEELGRIDFLLTDKTGTLTQNDMVLKKLHIGQAIFSLETIPSIQSLFEPVEPEACQKILENPMFQPTTLQQTCMMSGTSGTSQKQYDITCRLRQTLLALVICNNVTPIQEEMSKKIAYQASSPDEMAIVTFVAKTGLNLVERTDTKIVLRGFNNLLLQFEVLFVFPFSSENKRMGCIVRYSSYSYQHSFHSIAQDKIFFFLKGAESVLLPFLTMGDSDWLQEECDNFARTGLRTLVVAFRELSLNDLNTFTQSYNNAQISLTMRSERINACFALLEQNMTLLGLTGVEDRLQFGVPQTLEAFRHAGIRLWMLTGDKVETATCVAISAGFKTRQQTFVKFLAADFRTVHDAQTAFENIAFHPPDTVLVTDSQFLTIALTYFPHCFITTSCKAAATICCRCSPTQKAVITHLIQQITGKRIAAVGDGGNDVSMIMTSHCGIGIVGKEGKQASYAADFSINQFHHLHRLLLWHGRNNYQRSAKLAQFVMHRGLVISTIQVIFSSVFFFISMAIFQGWLTIGYATYYTMLPVFSLVLDIELSESVVFTFPELYSSLRAGRVMSQKTLFAWLWASIYQGAVIMLGAILLFETEFTDIISITFTSLILAEMLNVVSTVTSCHPFMVLAQITTLVIYSLSMIFLPNYFNLDFILSKIFFQKVLIIVFASWFPLHCLQLLIRCIKPSKDSKLML